MSTSTPTTPKTLLTVLISGNGTNLQALIDACASPSSVLSNCTITHVVSNRKAAYGLVRAQTAGIPTTYHNLVPYTRKHLAAIPTPKPNDDTTPTDPEKTTQIEAAKASARAAYDADLAHLLLHPPTPPATKPHLIICAGWMHVLTPSFLDPIAAAGIDVINLHPALPGAYNGANAIARAYADWRAGKVDRTGVMVHRVVREVDMGLPLVVREV
ncbi:Formyltransferase [Pseudovirgaria hyperparasitica]|uniref:phosphoribosylglycinamide formyltransferase 1 n=1 Tax=Pseudovirgaria hyperparasitica TaxID=470096 RepID=A0A6A6WAR6_9PEZI|nr:Formyltransferase [Pseudovirgaria hyperparasitica]KAF2759269.1 Formyltransferase [Pseudovirgaria hyperparasitica]